MTNAASFPEQLFLSPMPAVSGAIRVPGSKSLGNRALLLAASASGVSRLRGILDAGDTDAALSALSALGVEWRRDGDEVTIRGAGGAFPTASGDVDIGSSGTVGRFLPGLLAGSAGGAWRLVSTPQLAGRPIAPLVDALRGWGARLTQPEAGLAFPLTVAGGGLRGGDIAVSARASSQFASGALLALPLCEDAASVTIRDLDPEETYIDMTLDLMVAFGVDVLTESESPAEESDRTLGTARTVRSLSRRTYTAANIDIEADANTAMYFLALAALTGGRVHVANLNASSRQPGLKFLDILASMGATVSRGADGSGVTVAGGGLPLRGGFAIDMRAMSEMALTLGVLAAFADAPVTMRNLAHIRGHESDRLAALAALLADVGVRAEETPDGVTVHPARPKDIRAATIDPRDDHRLAMSFSLLGLAANGIAIRNPACVAKTAPTFFSLLRELGAEICATPPERPRD